MNPVLVDWNWMHEQNSWFVNTYIQIDTDINITLSSERIRSNGILIPVRGFFISKWDSPSLQEMGNSRGWSRKNTRWGWNSLQCEKVRKCSKNDRDKWKIHRSQTDRASYRQIWENLKIKCTMIEWLSLE